MAAVLTVSGVSIANVYKTFNFKTLDESANAADWDVTALWKLPEGFTQRVVSDETALNIYPDGHDDWHDMNVVNESGKMAGRFIYRMAEPNYGELEFRSELYEGRVIAINLETLEVSNFVKPGVNAPVEIGRPGDEGHQTGFDSVDNLAEAPNGDLIMIEDNKPSDIWFATTKTDRFGASRKVRLFASLTDPGAEGTGIYFSPTDPHTLYVNIQHSAADDGDGTWAISRKRRGHDRD